jgi:hypothetical protein
VPVDSLTPLNSVALPGHDSNEVGIAGVLYVLLGV